MSTHRHATCCCPACGTTLDAASNLGGAPARPGPGDFSVCIRCGTLLRYVETPEKGLTLDTVTRELAEKGLDPESFRSLVAASEWIKANVEYN